tara:strand:- start:3210 stop:5666 length:2457 start_codon:yes stop_codon:yes gene_type:complete
MRAIFTYPNNPFYIDPNYLGDDTSGFQRRIKDLKDGTYHTWYDVDPPTASVDDLMTAVGKYYNFYDTIGQPNISRYDMWALPLAELNMEQIPGRDPITWETVSSFPTLNSNNKPFAVNRFTTATAHGFTNGQLVIAPSGADIPSDGTPDAPQTAYVKAVDSTTFELYSNSALTENNTGEFDITSTSCDEVFIWSDYAASSNAYGAPRMGLHLPNGSGTFLDGQAIRRTEDLDNTNWSGDGANNVVRYVDNVGANDIRLYEDAALTTPLSVTPEFVNTNNGVNGSQGFSSSSGAVVHVLENIQYVGDQNARFQALACFNESGEKRIKGYVTVYSNDYGTDPVMTFSNVSTGVAIGAPFATTSDYNKPRYQKPIWIELNHLPAPQQNATSDFTLYDAETGGNKLEFSATSGLNVQTAYWDVWVLEPALNQSPNTCTVDEHTWFKYADGSVAGGDAFWPFWRDIEWNSTTNTAHHRYTPNATMWFYGANTYTYQDSGNVTQPGAEVTDYVALPGGYPYTLRSSVEGTPIVAATFAVTLNNLNRVTGITTTGGIYETPTATQFQQRVNPLPSQYVPPAQTPVQIAAAEDNFYLNDIWYTRTTEFDYEGTKNWPRSPIPASAEITESQPSVTTTSQAGIKYVRSGGFSKSGIELTYPLLNEADFRVLQNASQLAQGQRAVFRYIYRSQDNYNKTWIWQKNYNVSNGGPRLVSTRDNDRVFLFEGMQSNESEVVKAGQIISTGSSYNGEYSQNVADVDANVFGEAEARIAYKNGHWTAQLHNEIWLQPSNLVVTLADDDFTYTARADGLYDVSVRFDFAWYHAS